MAEDNEQASISTEKELEKKRVTSVMEGEVFQELEDWRARRGMSRSEAVNELVEDGLADEQWSEKVKDAQDTLARANVVAFATAAVAPDGGVNTRFEARDGVDDEYPIDVEGPYESLAVGLMSMLNSYAELLGIETDHLLAALRQMNERTGSDSYDLGGSNE